METYDEKFDFRDKRNLSLVTDFYELTMSQCYFNAPMLTRSLPLICFIGVIRIMADLLFLPVWNRLLALYRICILRMKILLI